MRVISCLRDLEVFGIYPLTGESCNLGLRILCDFDAVGRGVLRSRFGGSNMVFQEPWNSSTGGHKHVGSIMLGRDDYYMIGIFGLLKAGYKWVYSPQFKESAQSSVRNLKHHLRTVIKELWRTDAEAVDFDRSIEVVKAAEIALDQAAGDASPWGISPHCIYGFMEQEQKEAEEWTDIVKKFGYSYCRHVGSGAADDTFRNVHQFSGRVE